jgi:hypothetical protein
VLVSQARAGEPPAFLKPPGANALSALQQDLQEKVQEIIDDKCAFAGCHTGANAPKNLDMSEEVMLANLVGVKSSDTPFLRVKPGDPANSYIIKKLRGAPDIKGDRMPRGGRPLPEQEIAAFEAWIKSLPAGMEVKPPVLRYARAFPGLTLANLQTAETLDKGAFLYRIAHRFNGTTNRGFDELFGLDVGSSMMTQFAFPISNSLLATVERSKVNATFEIAAKWRIAREKTDGSMPISAAIYAGTDWATKGGLVDPGDSSMTLSRTDGERFALFAQLALSKQLGKRLSLLVVPGVLLNGNIKRTDEDALVTLGAAGRVWLGGNYSLFAEIVPVLSGDETADAPRRIKNGKSVFYDTFVAGLEIKAGGHVFHIFVTNSMGNTTNQYMSGGDANDVFRLGFNIYRILNYPF